MGRLAALVALALLVSVGVGPAAAVQPLGEDDLGELLVHGTAQAVRVATLKMMQREHGGYLGWLSWPELEEWDAGYVDGAPRHLLLLLCSRRCPVNFNCVRPASALQ
jgi:hypothetical protein